MAVNSLGSPSYWRFQIVPFALFIAATTELHLRQSMEGKARQGEEGTVIA